LRRLDKRPSQRLGGSDDGYTLTEMLVVIGVIALIAAVLTPSLLGNMQRARSKTAQMQLQTIAAAVETFRSDVGRYPSESEGLNSLVAVAQGAQGFEGWTGPYLKNPRYLQDPWNRNVEYKLDDSGQGFTVRSLGSDGATGGEGPGRDLIAP
jgi:general secretion pathway protein G